MKPEVDINSKEYRDWALNFNRRWKAGLVEHPFVYEKPKNQVAEGALQVIGQLSWILLGIGLLEKFC